MSLYDTYKRVAASMEDDTGAVFTSTRTLICASIPASCAVLLNGLSFMPDVQPLNAPLVLSNTSSA